MAELPSSRARQSKAAALEHVEGRGESPRVIAAGQGALAEKIVAIALANGVKVREDADLAEILAALEVDSPIPDAALATVAEILAYVYRANDTPPAAEAGP